jgi:microcystin-dependent protein
MTDPFVAEIRIFGFNFPPTGWAFCDGQLLPLSQNTALFSLLGTTYGGDGKSTFGLPALEGRGTVGSGQLNGGDHYYLGEEHGAADVTLLASEIPAHTHALTVSPDPGELQTPGSDRALSRSSPGQAYQTDTAANLAPLDPQTAVPVGSYMPHNNLPPVLALNYCIALQGAFPPRG